MFRKLKRLIRRRKKQTEPQLTPLQSLQNASASAVFMITNTIAELKGINEAIEREQEANNQRIREIEETQTALEKTKTDNDHIVTNFEALLR